jgi:hypothetical protein
MISPRSYPYKRLPPVFDPARDLTGRGRGPAMSKRTAHLPQIMPVPRATKAALAKKRQEQADKQWELDRTRLRDNWDLHWHGGRRKEEAAMRKRAELECVHRAEETERFMAMEKEERDERRAASERKAAREERKKKEAADAWKRKKKNGWCIL